ncbi:MAG: hypothetical protein IIX69_03740 [Clostridia bacterium]|nr:hypothetical protein [Clostridia bacterium]
MRKISCLLIAALMLVGLASVAFVGSAAEFAEIKFTEVTRVRQGGTYPRMTALENGALEYYFENGYKYSLDSALTFNTLENEKGTDTRINAAATQMVGEDSHTLTRANQHAIELSDGTMMMAYRSHSNQTVNGKFYTSIRVMTKTNYTGTYVNEQVVVEAVQSVTSGRHGYWEPFLIQLDDTTVAMYYADDLSPNDDGANQYIMVVLYDIKTGTWGTPSIAVNASKNMGREGMPMVSRLTDGSYVMAVESHCLQSSKYIFAVRLWFSRDGITWDKGVAVAAPDKTYYFYQSGLEYWCAAPCVTVLPDGRIAVSYQDNYANSTNRDYINTDKSYNATPCLIISKDKVTYNNASDLKAVTKGISSSFTSVSLNLTEHSSIKGMDYENDIYGIWNSTFYANGYLYYCSAVGYNTSTTSIQSLGTYVCRALVDADAVPNADDVAADYGTLHVSNPEQLLQIMNDSTMWKKNIVLDNDIDLSKTVYTASRGLGQTSIGYLNTAAFSGSFDGQGYTIKGLNINNTVSGNRTALFGYCDGATIKNCTLYGSVTSNGEYCGAFAGYSQNSYFINLTSYVTVSGTNYVGGIAGRVLGGSKGAELTSCVNYGSVTGTQKSVGGIIGLLDTNTGAVTDTTVDGCVNYGAISGSGYVGGILGQINHLTINGCCVYLKNCVNYGDVAASSDTACAAGIVGQLQVSNATTRNYNGVIEITACENNGDVTGKNYIAGIFANANFDSSNGCVVKLKLSECKNHGTIGGSDAIAYVGGIGGRSLGKAASRVEINLCFNDGALITGATGMDMGGIMAVAKYTDITNCEVRGSLTTANSSATGVGGIVGRTATSASVNRCYFAGETQYNPIVGKPVSCTGSNNYYFVNGSASDSYGALVQLDKGEDAYGGFDFENAWYATVLGPRLRFGKTFKPGDIDGNGVVGVLDIVILQRYLAEWSGYEQFIVYDSADVTGDGKIGLMDAVYMARHIAGWEDYADLGTR